MAHVPLSILRFFASHDLPFTQALLARAGVWRHEAWRNAPARSCRGKWHGYRMIFDLREFHERGAYLYGRLLDAPVQLVMMEALRAGDVFVDAGAHIGLLTLLGSRLVGPAGVVYAFEPNPEIFRRLEGHIGQNGVRNVRAFRVGLSDHEATLTLSVPPTRNTGAASLGGLAARHKAPALASYDVRVVTGDEALKEANAAPMFVKIDVEGHEVRALRGLEQTIRSRRPAILAEVNPEMLSCNGAKASHLLSMLAAWGYEAWLPDADWRRWRRRWALRLKRFPNDWVPARTINVLFLHADGPHRERLLRWLAPKHSRR
jgi:FkbM family methyltransferase